MGISKSYPIKKIINGQEKFISDSIIVNGLNYTTNGEGVIIVKNKINVSTITLDNTTTNHITIKSMCDTIIKTDKLIDEEYEQIQLERFASVELKFVGDNWYVMSSDGLKNS